MTHFELSETFKAIPSEIFNGWLNSQIHSKMTGSSANISKIENGKFSAWDGYITGKNSKLTNNKEIVQTWRTSDFNDEDPDSLLTIKLEAENAGTVLTLIHSNIPNGQPDYEQGWKEHYFIPMAQYFNS